MSDDLNKKIMQIADILGQDNAADNIKGLLSFLGAPGSKEESSSKSAEVPVLKEERAEKSDLEENLEMMRKVKMVMDRMNNHNDPRINLLSAIRPFLNNKRQKKLNNCIKMLQMSSLTKLVDDHQK